MHPLLTPNIALLTGTVGICLIFLELNRPGTILFGAVGLLLALFAAASLAQFPLRPWAVLLIVVAAGTLAFNLYWAAPKALLLGATAGLAAGFRYLLVADAVQPAIHPAVALLCGGVLGLSAAFLSRVAFRARRLKAIH